MTLVSSKALLRPCCILVLRRALNFATLAMFLLLSTQSPYARSSLRYLLKNVKIGGVAFFALYPVIFAIALAGFIAGMAEVSGAFDPVLGGLGNITIFAGWPGKTNGQVIADSLAAKFPYPGQWGAPIFKGYAIGPMIGAMMVYGRVDW